MQERNEPKVCQEIGHVSSFMFIISEEVYIADNYPKSNICLFIIGIHCVKSDLTNKEADTIMN